MSTPPTSDSAEVLARFEQHQDLVPSIARQVLRSCGEGVEMDDLMSFARQGLLDAARRYDAARGVPFAAYARLRMRGATIDGVRGLKHLPRRVHHKLRALEAATQYSEGVTEDVLAGPRTATPADAERALSEHLAGMATAMALGLVARTGYEGDGERVAISQGADPEAAVAQAELSDRVRQAIESLPAQEAELVRRHYLEGERFDVVSTELGLSKSWGSRLHARALQRLSKRLRGLEGD
jgi:RNA polymerase sigma factor for flagellar operon FliA